MRGDDLVGVIGILIAVLVAGVLLDTCLQDGCESDCARDGRRGDWVRGHKGSGTCWCVDADGRAYRPRPR